MAIEVDFAAEIRCPFVPGVVKYSGMKNNINVGDFGMSEYSELTDKVLEYLTILATTGHHDRNMRHSWSAGIQWDIVLGNISITGVTVKLDILFYQNSAIGNYRNY